MTDRSIRMRSALHALKSARDQLSERSRWCQRAIARDKNSSIVSPESIRATSWDPIGAVSKFARGEVLIDALKALRRTVNEQPLTTWNDASEHAEVLRVFGETIARIEKALS